MILLVVICATSLQIIVMKLLYNNCMHSILDRPALMTSKRVFTCPSAPWMSSNVIEAKGQRRKAERKWRSSKCQSDLAVFKRKRNHMTFLMNEARGSVIVLS